MGCCKSLVRVVALSSEIRKTNHMATISVNRLALHSLWPVRDRAKVRGGGQSNEKVLAYGEKQDTIVELTSKMDQRRDRGAIPRKRCT